MWRIFNPAAALICTAVHTSLALALFWVPDHADEREPQGWGEGGRDRDRDREIDRERERQRARDRETESEREREDHPAVAMEWTTCPHFMPCAGVQIGDKIFAIDRVSVGERERARASEREERSWQSTESVWVGQT
jgi:hypothetical protein